MVAFATLGPAGSNHELVAGRYFEFHGLDRARLVLVDNFDGTLEMMVRGEVDHVLQVAVHPAATATVARARFVHDIHVVDCFISASHPLGVLTRREVARPRTLALQPATRDYTDLSAWETLILETSTASVAEGLLAGRYDSGLTALHHAERHPDRLRVDLEIGTVDDPWLVYGRCRVSGGRLLAWPDSPARRLYGAT